MLSHTFNETIEKRYFHTGEMAYRLGINAPALRYWCRIFGIFPKRNKSNERLFTSEDFEKLNEVRRLLKEERYTIEGARKKLKPI